MRVFASAAVIGLLAAPAIAEQHGGSGDAAAGEQVFNRCQTCHVVQNEAGETLAGRNGRTGPNLYGVVGRQAGSIEDFRYSTSMTEAGEQGYTWDAENMVPYLLDPTAHLKEVLDDSGARGKMSFRLRDEQEARDVIAYLASLAPAGGGS